VGMVAVNVGVGVGEATDGVGAVCTWVIRVAWVGVGRWCTSGAAVGSMGTLVAVVGMCVDEAGTCVGWKEGKGFGVSDGRKVIGGAGGSVENGGGAKKGPALERWSGDPRNDRVLAGT